MPKLFRGTDMAKPRIAQSDAYAKIFGQLLSVWVMSVYPSFRTDFMKFGCFSYFLDNLSEKTRVSLKSYKNNGQFTRASKYIYDNTSLSSSWNETCPRNPSHTKSKTHNFCLKKKVSPPPTENRTVYRIV